jgi:predicted phosphodiesterase
VFEERLMKKDKMLGLIDLVLALLHVVVTPTSSLLDPCPCTAAIVVFGHTHRRVLEMPLVLFP